MEAQKPKIEHASEREEREETARDRGERGSDGTAESKLDPQHKKEGASASKSSEVKALARGRKSKNNVRKLRMERMMSKAELARRANLSTLTVDRVERGMPCRMDSKRKILEALGLKPSDRVMVFGDAPDEDD